MIGNQNICVKQNVSQVRASRKIVYLIIVFNLQLDYPKKVK